MNKKGLFIFLLAIFSLALISYFKAVAPVGKQTTSRPQIQITPQVFDFGKIKYKNIAKYNFTVKNLGKKNLEIKRVATSCACTSAKVEKNILKPNEKTNLKVIYNPQLMGSAPHAKGKQERIIYIKTNDPVNPQVEVKIYAYVE